MTVKFYLVPAIAAVVFIPAVSAAKEMTIQERLDNVRAARALFFELDDIYRSYKRDFAKKDKKQIDSDKKNISIIHRKLDNLPSHTKGGSGDIIFDCRDVYGPIFAWITDITGSETYNFIPNDLKHTVNEDYKKMLRQQREYNFITTNTRCINLMNEKEENFLKQLGKK